MCLVCLHLCSILSAHGGKLKPHCEHLYVWHHVVPDASQANFKAPRSKGLHATQALRTQGLRHNYLADLLLALGVSVVASSPKAPRHQGHRHHYIAAQCLACCELLVCKYAWANSTFPINLVCLVNPSSIFSAVPIHLPCPSIVLASHVDAQCILALCAYIYLLNIQPMVASSTKL